MRKRDSFRRIIGMLIALTLLFASVPRMACLSVEEITVTPAPVQTCPRKSSVAVTRIARDIQDTSAQASFMMQAAMGEFNSLNQYAAGKNPTENKPIDAPGQNTKRNTATTLTDILQKSRLASSFYFKLLPYSDNENIWELCAFYTPFFGEEQMIRTGLLHDFNTRTIYRSDGTGVVGTGYDFNFGFDTFYAADDPWQRNFGFCPLYDHLAFLIGDVYETIRVPFSYDGRDWMIQIWKGIYSGNMLGAEIGLYNKPTDRTASFYDCAADPDRIEMSFVLYNGDECILETKPKTTWWQTAFTYHRSVKPSALTLCGKLTLKDVQMAKAFAASLAAQNKQVTVSRTGKTVTFTW